MSGPADVTRAAERIRAGGLVTFPTETVYGLGANALDATAVERIFAAKGRPRTSPLIVHVASIDMARDLAAEWPAEAQKLAEKYWPGPLTLVVKKRPNVPDIVTAGLDTVGLRMPAHPMALELIRVAGVPIAAPSANRFTELSPTTAGHVPPKLSELVLDGGPSRVGIESTVLSLVGEPALLRPGVVSQSELESVLGRAIRPADAGMNRMSPGMHARHYRPRTPLYLGTTGRPGRGVTLRIGKEMPSDAQTYAAALYETLHRLDGEGWDWIAVEMPPETPEWAGVADRLRRAAEPE